MRITLVWNRFVANTIYSNIELKGSYMFPRYYRHSEGKWWYKHGKIMSRIYIK